MKTNDSFPIEPFDKPVMGTISRPANGKISSRIRYGGTTWFARPYINGLELTLAEGDMAFILARQGNTLLIMPTHRHSS
ncbi:MAG: NfeD family protein [Cyanobacteria bacterium J06636_16]